MFVDWIAQVVFQSQALPQFLDCDHPFTACLYIGMRVSFLEYSGVWQCAVRIKTYATLAILISDSDIRSI